MTREEYLEKIIQALTKFNKDQKVLTAETKFQEISRLDSMAIVDFQISLKKSIGAKASLLPKNMSLAILGMTLGEFADLLVSLG